MMVQQCLVRKIEESTTLGEMNNHFARMIALEGTPNQLEIIILWCWRQEVRNWMSRILLKAISGQMCCVFLVWLKDSYWNKIGQHRSSNDHYQDFTIIQYFFGSRATQVIAFLKYQNSTISFLYKFLDITILFVVGSNTNQWVSAYQVLLDEHHFLQPKQLTRDSESQKAILQSMLETR